MGSGLSGSTLLNIILGMHPKIYGSGEIDNINKFGKRDYKCSCEIQVVNCSFWSKIVAEYIKKLGDKKFSQYQNDIHFFENFKSVFAWLNVLLGFPFHTKRKNEYMQSAYEFYKTTLNETGKSIIIDASKNPLRALVLSKNKHIDLKLIHLVRDGRAVAWAIERNKKKSGIARKILRTVWFWAGVNWQADFTKLLARTPTVFVKLENIVGNPKVALDKVGTALNLDLKGVSEIISDEFKIPQTHVIGGSLVRFKEKIKIVPRNDWMTKLSSRKQRNFSLFAWISMLKYGYSIQRRK